MGSARMCGRYSEALPPIDSPPPGRRGPLMTPLLLGGGVRGGGDKHGHNIFYNRMVQFLIHPTPNPSPKGAGNCAGIRNVSE